MRKKLEGIGGWLILPAFSLVSLLLTSIWLLFDSLGDENSILFLALFFFMVFLNITFFCKKKIFLKVIIPLYNISIALSVAGFLVGVALIGYHPEQIGESLGALFASVIWREYFKQSERVKNTFVN
jgi:hypothetical protein